MKKVSVLSDRCKGCGLCVEVCPKKILEISKSELNAKGYHPVVVTNEEACISCAMCATMCPDVVLRIEK